MSSIPTRGNFIFAETFEDTWITILYKNVRNVKFSPFTQTSSIYLPELNALGGGYATVSVRGGMKLALNTVVPSFLSVTIYNSVVSRVNKKIQCVDNDAPQLSSSTCT